jgi:hypothetical protein
VEYLVTGQEGKQGKPHPPLSPNLRLLVDIVQKLTPKNQKLAIKIVKVLRE